MLKRVEVHITYKCNLECLHCNRGCFSHIDFAPDLTIGQFNRFLSECKELDFRLDDIVIIGGEPTLHPQCIEITKLAYNYARDNNCRVIMFSNGYSKESREIIKYLESNNFCLIDYTTFKDRRMNFPESVFLSPSDISKQRTEVCGAFTYCGFSMDELGYTCCSLGGTISSLLCPEVRTRNLKDLLDEEFVKWQLSKLCKHCGALLCTLGDVLESMLYNFCGTKMTKTWYDAFKKL